MSRSNARAVHAWRINRCGAIEMGGSIDLITGGMETHRVTTDTGEQAHLILGTSPIEGRIGGVVDIPNACCSVFLPTEIFDEDIRPGGQGPQRRDRGQVCVTS